MGIYQFKSNPPFKLLYQDIERYVKIEDCIFVPNGIKNEFIESDNDIQILEEEKKNEYKLIYLSNMIKTKGSLDLINAMRIITKINKNIKLEFAGGWRSSFSKDDFEKIINEFNLKDYVKHVGAVYGDDKSSFLRSGDIFVFPTKYKNECFPLVLLEAMSFGLPVITTNEGAITEVIINKMNGIIAEKNNPKDLADKILTLVNDKELRDTMKHRNFKSTRKLYIGEF